MFIELPKDGPQYDDWALACGYVILRFGTIEGLTHQLARYLLGEEVNKKTDGGTRRRPRLDILIEAVEKRSTDECWRVLAPLLREVQALALKRNLIVHNGLAFGPSIESPSHIRNKDRLESEKRITFEQLREFSIAVEALLKNLTCAVLVAYVADDAKRLEDYFNPEVDDEDDF